MTDIVKKVETNYYGHCKIDMFNVSNPCTVKVINNGKVIFQQVAKDYGGSWQNTCVDVPLFPGENEIHIYTNYMYWEGKNYTQIGITPYKVCYDAKVVPFKDACKVVGDTVICGIKGMVVMDTNLAIWGGAPWWCFCCATMSIGQILIHAPFRHEFYKCIGYRIYKANDLANHINYSNSYVVACKYANIDRNNTYFVINGKKCYPNKYDVYEDTTINFNVRLVGACDDLIVSLYDKKSETTVWSKRGSVGTYSGSFKATKDMELEFRVIIDGKIVDRFG